MLNYFKPAPAPPMGDRLPAEAQAELDTRRNSVRADNLIKQLVLLVSSGPVLPNFIWVAGLMTDLTNTAAY